MAKEAKFEILTGAVDNVNTVFTTPHGVYVAGTTRLLVRGIPQTETDTCGGWFETDPSTGTVTLKEAPCEGDLVQLMYCIEVADTPESEITPITGCIETTAAEISGYLCSESEVLGCLEELPELLCGSIETESIVGNLSTLDEICGIIVECD